MWRNRHGLWKQKAVCNDAKFEAMINKSGLDTSCVVPQYCQPLDIGEACFKIHVLCRCLRNLIFFLFCERTGEGLAKYILKVLSKCMEE